MLIRLNNTLTGESEWTILEFQGEMVGEEAGRELGSIFIDEVRVRELDNHENVWKSHT